MKFLLFTYPLVIPDLIKPSHFIIVFLILLLYCPKMLRCPNPDDNTVDLLQNGVSTSSRFSFEMFIFTANSTKVYLHCGIHLCLKTDNHCSVVSL